MTKFPLTFLVNAEQREALEEITRENELSLTQVVNDALGAYLPAHFSVEWPTRTLQRRKGLWRPPKTRLGSMWMAGIILSAEQDRVLREIAEEHFKSESGALTAIIEGALVYHIPKRYGKAYASHKREGSGLVGRRGRRMVA